MIKTKKNCAVILVEFQDSFHYCSHMLSDFLAFKIPRVVLIEVIVKPNLVFIIIANLEEWFGYVKSVFILPIIS